MSCTVRLFLAVGVLLSACSRSGLDGGDGAPALVIVGNGTLEFGATGVGFSAGLLVTLNAGVAVTDVDAGSLPAPFGFAGGTFPGARGTCDAAQIFGSCALDVVFTPVDRGSYQETLTLGYTLDGRRRRLSATMQGEGTDVGTVPDAARSSIAATSPVIADGVDVARVDVVLRDAADLPVPGRTVAIGVSGSGNVIVACTVTDGAGRSTCGVRSSVAEEKLINTTTPVVLAGVTVSFVDRSVVRMAFTRQPVLGPGGVLTTQPEVSLYDADDRLVTAESGLVVLSVAGNGGLSGDIARVPVGGVVDFSGAGLTLERGGVVRLVARAANGVTVESEPLSFVPFALSKVVLRSGPRRNRGHVDGPASTALVHNPRYAVSNGTSMFFTESEGCTLRRMTIGNGQVDTLAGSPFRCQATLAGTGAAARFRRPAGLAVDGNELFIADQEAHVVVRVDLATNTSAIWVGAVDQPGTVNGPRLTARLFDPTSVALDATYLYIGDCTDCTLRRMERATGTVQTFAGGTCGSQNGTGTGAQLGCISDIELVPGAIWATHDSLHRRIDLASAVVTTPAVARFGNSNLAYYAAANAIVFNSYDAIDSYDVSSGNETLPRVGVGDVNRYVDGTLSESRFFDPSDLIEVANGIIILDSENSAVRRARFDSDRVDTIIGLSNHGMDKVDGGPTEARWEETRAIAGDGTALYVAEAERIVRVGLVDFVATTWAGAPEDDAGVVDGPRIDARIPDLHDMVSDGHRVFFSDFRQIRVLEADGTVRTLAGAGATGTRDAIGTAARFTRPDALAYDRGMLYVADEGLLRTVDVRTGQVTTIFGTLFDHSCEDTSATEAGSIDAPSGMVVVGDTLYLADCGRLRAFDLATRTIASLTSKSDCAFVEGTGTAASTGCSVGRITSDGAVIYIANQREGIIERFDPVAGQLVRLSGDVSDRRELDGALTDARFVEPWALYYGFGTMWTANDFNVRGLY